MHIKKCPDCGGSLEAGAILDHTYGGVGVQRYARADVPDKKGASLSFALEEQFNDVRKVINYRCVECNRLFSYAQGTIQVENVNTRAAMQAFIVVSISIAIAILISILDAL